MKPKPDQPSWQPKPTPRSPSPWAQFTPLFFSFPLGPTHTLAQLAPAHPRPAARSPPLGLQPLPQRASGPPANAAARAPRLSPAPPATWARASALFSPLPSRLRATAARDHQRGRRDPYPTAIPGPALLNPSRTPAPPSHPAGAAQTLAAAAALPHRRRSSAPPRTRPSAASRAARTPAPAVPRRPVPLRAT